MLFRCRKISRNAVILANNILSTKIFGSNAKCFVYVESTIERFQEHYISQCTTQIMCNTTLNFICQKQLNPRIDHFQTLNIRESCTNSIQVSKRDLRCTTEFVSIVGVVQNDKSLNKDREQMVCYEYSINSLHKRSNLIKGAVLWKLGDVLGK